MISTRLIPPCYGGSQGYSVGSNGVIGIKNKEGSIYLMHSRLEPIFLSFNPCLSAKTRGGNHPCWERFPITAHLDS